MLHPGLVNPGNAGGPGAKPRPVHGATRGRAGRQEPRTPTAKGVAPPRPHSIFFGLLGCQLTIQPPPELCHVTRPLDYRVEVSRSGIPRFDVCHCMVSKSQDYMHSHAFFHIMVVWPPAVRYSPLDVDPGLSQALVRGGLRILPPFSVGLKCAACRWVGHRHIPCFAASVLYIDTSSTPSLPSRYTKWFFTSFFVTLVRTRVNVS